MKVFLQVINKTNGVYQTGMIDEPVVGDKHIVNALAHFGVTYGDVNWYTNYQLQNTISKFGEVEGTSKVVSIVAIE